MDPGRRRLYINLGLAGGLLLLAAAVRLAPETPEPHSKPFAHIDADALSRIEILLPGQAPVLLQNRNGEWIAPETPPEAALDPRRLRNVLNILNEAVTRSYALAGLDLKEFGLDPPAAELKLDGHAFAFGAGEALSGRRYVRYGDRLYLLTDTHYPLLSRGLGNLLQQTASETEGNDPDRTVPEFPEPQPGTE